MGSQERRSRERVETREKILDAARAMFVRHGYEATTMRAIAQRIEYTPTAIYHHFRNKEALLTELCNVDFQALVAAFSGSAASRILSSDCCGWAKPTSPSRWSIRCNTGCSS